LPVELLLLLGSCLHSSWLTEVSDGASSSPFGVCAVFDQGGA